MTEANPTRFTAKAEDSRKKFEKLLHDFQSIDDPVERYIKRQQMLELKSELQTHGINVQVP